MNQHALVQVTPPSVWKWPVDIISYDRTPWLSGEEQVALESWIVSRERELGGRIPQHVKQTLQRLLLPISDVLDRTPIGESSRRGTIRLIALGMHQRHTAFWAWSAEEWIELLSVKKHQTDESLFQQV